MFGFGNNPFSCPGVTTGRPPEPMTALRAMNLLSHFSAIEPQAEILRSLVLEAASDPAIRETPGLRQAHAAAQHLFTGIEASQGALRRVLCGDPTGLQTLATAGHLMIQSFILLAPHLERLIMEIAPETRVRIEHIRAGFDALESILRPTTRDLEALTGRDVWIAAKAQAAVLTGYAAE